MRKRIFFAISLSGYLCGCATSGVLPLGPDTYTISTSNEISPAYAKKAAITEASEFCQKQGKHMVPLNVRQGAHVDAFGDNIATYDYNFRCVAEDDPELARPNMRKEADVVIETREK